MVTRAKIFSAMVVRLHPFTLDKSSVARLVSLRTMTTTWAPDAADHARVPDYADLRDETGLTGGISPSPVRVCRRR